MQGTNSVRKICGAYGGHETAKARYAGRSDGGCELRGKAGKRVGGVSPGRPQIFRYQRRPEDDCSPGLGIMTQDIRTRSGTFNGEMDGRRENQSWTTACRCMPECDGKGQGKDSPKQACLCRFISLSTFISSTGYFMSLNFSHYRNNLMFLMFR